MRAPSKQKTRAATDARQTRSGIEVTPAELAALRPLAARLDMTTTRRASAQLSGTKRSAVRGRGVEFAEVRAYVPGDEVRQIDWRVTARTGTPHSKLFEEERERPVIVVTDMRQPMRFGTRQCFKSVAAARAAALRMWGAVLRGDRVGGVTLSDTGFTSHRMRRDRNAMAALIAGLAGATSASSDGASEGWWVLVAALLTVGLGIHFIFRARRRSLKRAALRELDSIAVRFRAGGDVSDPALRLATLLRRVAIARFPRRDVASLEGADWSQFLLRTSRGRGLTEEMARDLARAVYAGPSAAPREEHVSAWIIGTKEWIGGNA